VSPVSAEEAAWNSPDEAQAFLAQALPKATRENPGFISKADASVSEWFTDRLSFSRGADNAFHIVMFESFTRKHDGATTPGQHEASFSLADVAISEFEEAGDVTPTGAPSRGVLFTCAKPGCVEARWNDEASRADKTDISIQNDTARARILSAFRYLKEHSL
jgi:hypothetical protein